MTTAPQIKKAGGDKRWLVKNEQGETFGPVDFETLKLWAQDGRLAPTNTLSDDKTTWSPVTQFPELEMDWVAEVSPGVFYGPIHKLALESLKKEGSLPAEAVVFQRPPPVRSARKTQPVSAIYPVFPVTPAQKNEPDALRALERQLDLERQRSHDIMKELQQVEVHVAAAEARAEASEKAHKHYAAQSEQAQQLLTVQLEQVNKQLAHIHAQVLAKDEALQRTEQRLGSTEKLESLIHACLTHLENPPKAPTPASQPEQTSRVLASELSTLQTRITSELNQSFLAEIATSSERLTSALTATQRETAEQASQAIAQAVTQSVTQTVTQTVMQAVSQAVPQVTQAVTQVSQAVNQEIAQRVTQAVAEALKQGTAPITEQLVRNREEIERFRSALNTSRAQTSESVVSAVSTLITREHDDLYQKLSDSHNDLYKKIMDETAAGHEKMLERTEAAMTHGRELMMRVTGDSQRLSIEYIVRELTAAMNQALQAGRENLLHSMRSGWTDVKQQSAVIESQIQKLKEFHERLERELTLTLERLIATAAASKPAVERTYVTAEAVEVMPPERPRKKVNPEPEVMNPPPAGNGQAGGSKAAGQGVSIADIEQQARRELERLGAQGMNIFKRKK